MLIVNDRVPIPAEGSSNTFDRMIYLPLNPRDDAPSVTCIHKAARPVKEKINAPFTALDEIGYHCTGSTTLNFQDHEDAKAVKQS